MVSIEVFIAEQRYAEAWVDFRSAARAENQLLKGELALQSGGPFPQAEQSYCRDSSPTTEAQKKTREKLDAFNRAAAIYRKTLAVLNGNSSGGTDEG